MGVDCGRWEDGQSQRSERVVDDLQRASCGLRIESRASSVEDRVLFSVVEEEGGKGYPEQGERRMGRWWEVEEMKDTTWRVPFSCQPLVPRFLFDGGGLADHLQRRYRATVGLLAV